MFSIQAVEVNREGYIGEREVSEEGTASEWLNKEITTLDTLNSLLIEFKDLFAEPASLPPTRALDHIIPLKPNLEPVNIRPY